MCSSDLLSKVRGTAAFPLARAVAGTQGCGMLQKLRLFDMFTRQEQILWLGKALGYNKTLEHLTLKNSISSRFPTESALSRLLLNVRDLKRLVLHSLNNYEIFCLVQGLKTARKKRKSSEKFVVSSSVSFQEGRHYIGTKALLNALEKCSFVNRLEGCVNYGSEYWAISQKKEVFDSLNFILIPYFG